MVSVFMYIPKGILLLTCPWQQLAESKPEALLDAADVGLPFLPSGKLEKLVYLGRHWLRRLDLCMPPETQTFSGLIISLKTGIGQHAHGHSETLQVRMQSRG
jgi:hypothetical protein